MATLLTYARALPLVQDDAFDRTIETPLPALFSRRFGPLPAIRSVTRNDDPDDPWRTPGQSRDIVLADGGRLREELTAVDAPRRFGYRLDRIQGPMRLLTDEVRGEWSFEPVGTGTRIRWTWQVTPAYGASKVAMPAFGACWRGYARLAFDELEKLVLT